MKIVEYPSPITGHRFRHGDFLRWIAETQSLSIARLWARVLSPDASIRWLEYQATIQERFEKLYLDFCRNQGIDTSDILFDRPTINDSQFRRSLARSPTELREARTWEVVSIESLLATKEEAMVSASPEDSFEN